MPERLPTVKPTVTVGSILTSGDPNTGQICDTPGGSKTVQRMSGVVGDNNVNLWVGGGRLDTVHIHCPAAASGFTTNAAYLSGLPVVFYDSAVAISGGPLNASGHKVVAKVAPYEPSMAGAILANSGLLGQGRGPIVIGAVFTSGLCYTGASGIPGWTATFTPVVSGTTGN